MGEAYSFRINSDLGPKLIFYFLDYKENFYLDVININHTGQIHIKVHSQLLQEILTLTSLERLIDLTS